MTDTYKSKPVNDEDDEFWDPMADIDKNKETQIDDSDVETFWECPTKPEDVVEYKIELNNESNSTSA